MVGPGNPPGPTTDIPHDLRNVRVSVSKRVQNRLSRGQPQAGGARIEKFGGELAVADSAGGLDLQIVSHGSLHELNGVH